MSFGQHTYYEILNLSPDASREDIELACLGLWNKYKILRTTPLWQELSRQIEVIHATLSDQDTRAAYNRHLLGPDAAKPFMAENAATLQASGEQEKAPKRLPAFKFRKVFSFNATGGALLFNSMISHVRPQEWSDLSTLGWLSLFFSIAATFLVWSVANLYPAKPADEVNADPQHAV